VSAVSSDNKRSDEYWIGVRDALRMVDSFNRWAARNPERAKSLDDFIHDGLIAAAKRCESCLREKLGLSFVQDDQSEADALTNAPSEPETMSSSDSESDEQETVEEATPAATDTTYEISIESTEYDRNHEIPIELEDSSPSIDSVERLEDEAMDGIVIDGPQRDFTSDFDLVEPPPLEVESDERKLEEPSLDETLDEPGLEEIEILDKAIQESEPVEKRPAFTWSDYEAAVTPASEPEPSDSHYDEGSIEEDDYFKESPAEESYVSDISIDEPPEPSVAPTDWSADDEDSSNEDIILEEANEDLNAEIDVAKDTEQVESKSSITEPPAPPPPPESEEDEEERKRRARRLFFGT
jgi:hypothetical protein